MNQFVPAIDASPNFSLYDLSQRSQRPFRRANNRLYGKMHEDEQYDYDCMGVELDMAMDAIRGAGGASDHTAHILDEAINQLNEATSD